LGVGEGRIIFDPEAEDLIQDAITRSTIRGLIGMGAIKIAPEEGVSRGRARIAARARKARRHGSFKGGLKSRTPRKQLWVNKVRSLRWRLKVARDRGKVSKELYWKLYRQVKGGQVRDVKQLLSMMKEGRR